MTDPRRIDWLRVGGVALLVRTIGGALLSLAVALSHVSLFPDEILYLSEARRIMDGASFSSNRYSNVLGLLFEVTGPNSWLPRTLNVLAGAALAVVIYEIVYLVAGRRAAQIAGIAVALWPSLVLWSIVIQKDSLLLLGLFVAVLGALGALRGRWVGAVVALAGLAVVLPLRPYPFVLFELALVVTLLVRLASTRFKNGGVAAALVVGVVVLGAIGGVGVLGTGYIRSQATVDRVDVVRTEGSVGDTGFASDDTSDLGDVIVGMPRGLFHSLVGPFPWDAGPPLARALMIVELPVWLATIAIAFLALARIPARKLIQEWALMLLLAIGVALVLAVYEGNAGTAFRQRSMLIPIVIALAATKFDKPPA